MAGAFAGDEATGGGAGIALRTSEGGVVAHPALNKTMANPAAIRRDFIASTDRQKPASRNS
jgi:hypothetical protein